jgi:hypothetical protein
MDGAIEAAASPFLGVHVLAVRAKTLAGHRVSTTGESGPLVRDARRFELRGEELEARLPAAIEKAFGAAPKRGDDGWWRVSQTGQGALNEVAVRLEDDPGPVGTPHTPGGARVVIEVIARRGAVNALAQGATTVAAMAAWFAAGAMTFGDFMARQSAGRLVAWLAALAVALLLTVRAIRRARVHATGVLAPIERLWRALDTLGARPRIARGYRVAPALLDAVEPDASDDGEAEAEAAEEEERAARRG